MSKMSKLKNAIRRALREAFAEVATDKGVLGWDGEEDLKAGDAVYIVDADGNHVAAEDGDYTTEDGKVITVADGKASEIKDPEAEVATFGAVSTDKGELYHEGEEDLKEGDAVYADESLETPAEDGEYKTEDGKTITVVEGRVASIEDAEAEIAPEDLFTRIRVAHEESYDEKFRKIAEAIAAKGYEDFYVVDAGDDFAVIALYDEAGEKYLRFAISWNEDGSAFAGEAVEVKPMFVPLDMPSPFSKEERAELARLRKENAALRRQPAARPAHEEVQMHTASVETGVKGLDRLARRLGK